MLLYYFKCPHCGEYQTTEETFKKFCPPGAWRKIQDSKTAVGGMTAFKECCPRCEPSGKSFSKVILLQPKKHQILN